MLYMKKPKNGKNPKNPKKRQKLKMLQKGLCPFCCDEEKGLCPYYCLMWGCAPLWWPVTMCPVLWLLTWWRRCYWLHADDDAAALTVLLTMTVPMHGCSRRGKKNPGACHAPSVFRLFCAMPKGAQPFSGQGHWKKASAVTNVENSRSFCVICKKNSGIFKNVTDTSVFLFFV